ncbi:MAG: hypothetical protein HY036_06550 [Nitrospirae bacterium]|nr:hypothetical protein [Nitrospirota bacterium]
MPVYKIYIVNILFNYLEAFKGMTLPSTHAELEAFDMRAKYPEWFIEIVDDLRNEIKNYSLPNPENIRKLRNHFANFEGNFEEGFVKAADLYLSMRKS